MFSNIDLRSWYHQLHIKEEDIPKTSFKMRFNTISSLFYLLDQQIPSKYS
jgi:hypothetical protein